MNACSGDDSIYYCPEEIDHGLVALSETSLALIPDGYVEGEKLIYKNEQGEELIFRPVYTEIFNLGAEGGGSVNECPDGTTSKQSYQSEGFRWLYLSDEGRHLQFNLGTGMLFPKGEQPIEIQNLYLRLFNSIIENGQSKPVVDCYMGMPADNMEEIEYNGANGFVIYHESISIKGEIFKDVYTRYCDYGDDTAYSKDLKVLVAFTDHNNENWVFDRSETPSSTAADFSLPDTTNQMINLYEVEGKLTLIDFWASWCEPCLIESEETLKPLYEEYHAEGLEIIGVSIDADAAEWKQAIVEEQLPWIHVHEIEGYDSDIFDKYSVFGIPTIYVLDENKNIISRNLRGNDLKQFVEQYFE